MTPQQPTREQVVQLAEQAGGYLYADTICYGDKACDDFATALVTLARADHEAKIEEQAAEIERLKTDNELLRNLSFRDERDELRQQLAALLKPEPVAYMFSVPGITKLDVCPHGGKWKPLYAAPPIQSAQAPAVKYGCHCDLEDHMVPDDCVIDEGRFEDCVYANRYGSKEECQFWRPIKITLQPAALADDVRDSELLDYLESLVLESRTGVSIDFVRFVEDGLVTEKGFRLSSFHNLRDRHPSLRAAIAAAKGEM